MHPAIFFTTLDRDEIECCLCPHYCRLKPGQTGACYVRHNVAGKLLTSSYGRPMFMAVEPIEKKYLFHVWPGSKTLSLGTPGCNLGCQYCINWRISQRGAIGTDPVVAPAEVIERAQAEDVDCIAFTYTEPTIFIEYAMEIARLAHRVELGVVAKSNGYMAPTVLKEMASWLDAINVDLKAWHGQVYQKVIKGTLDPVLENLNLAKELGLWVEISTLVVPGINDTPEILEEIARFIAETLGSDTPWHIQRFFPNYRMLDYPTTSQAQLKQALEAGRHAGLHYIYTKDLRQGQFFNTFCPHCQTVVLERVGYNLVNNCLNGDCCPLCGQSIPGVGLICQQDLREVSTEPEII